MILIPSVLALQNYAALRAAEEEAARLHSEVEQLRQQLDAAQGQNASAGEAGTGELWAQAPAELGLSAETPAYQSLYPDFYAPQPLNAQAREEGVVYLTFDDGPSENTDHILKILAEKNVRATFFVNGHTDERARQRMRAIAAQGHTLGMHSFSHDYDIIYQSVESFLDDMYRVFLLIQETTGETPTVFRFPGGSINSYNYGIYQELMAEMLRRGFVPHDWNLSAQDALAKPVSRDEVVNNVLRDAPGKVRGFVLMHDEQNQKSTVRALGAIIERLQEMGFQFDRIHPDTAPVLFYYPE